MYLERFNLAGRNAVITGGGRGIGLACADALAEAGAHVTIVDRDAAQAQSGLAFDYRDRQAAGFSESVASSHVRLKPSHRE